MLLSIVIATYKRPRELAEALKSTAALLPLNFEIVVSDDSPTGEGREVCEQARDLYGLNLQYNKREFPTGGKPAIVRNEAATLVAGKYLYFLDDDDSLVPQGVMSAIDALEKSGRAVAIANVLPFSRNGLNASAVAHEIQFFKEARSYLLTAPTLWKIVSQLNFGQTILVCSSCLVRQSVFHKIGGFDASIPLCEDVEMFQRAIETGDYTYVDNDLLIRSCGESSLITNATQEKLNASYFLIQEKFQKRIGNSKFLYLKIIFKLNKYLEKLRLK